MSNKWCHHVEFEFDDQRQQAQEQMKREYRDIIAPNELTAVAKATLKWRMDHPGPQNLINVSVKKDDA